MSSPVASKPVSPVLSTLGEYAEFFVPYAVQRKPRTRAIGTGSYSDVLLYHRADDHSIELAIKFPRYTEADEVMNQKMDRAWAKDMQRFFLTGLSHPNIIQYLGLTEGDTGVGVGIVMPYASNKSLLSYLEHNQKADRVKTLQDVAAGLKYLHDPKIKIDGQWLSVTHGDVHPGNVLIQGDGTAVLSDFGLSKLSKGGSPNSLTIRMDGPDGWPAYIGPELHGSKPIQYTNGDGVAAVTHPAVTQQPEYEGRRTVKADIFAFGMLIYETFGIKPAAGLGFDKPLAQTVMFALVRDRRPARSGITRADFPNAYWALIETCWVGNAALRPDMGHVCERLKV